MSNSKNTTTISDNGFFFVLFIVFLVLKLTGAIAWSWWWVTAPLWAPAALILLILGIMFLVAYILDKKNARARRRRKYGYFN